MTDNELIKKAIDNYEALSPSHRKVLKLLVELAIDDIVIMSVMKLSKVSGFSRELIYQSLECLEKERFIDRIRKGGDKSLGKLHSIVLKAAKINEIIKLYNIYTNTEAKYKNNNDNA